MTALLEAPVVERPPAAPDEAAPVAAGPPCLRVRWWFVAMFAAYGVLGALLAFQFDSFNGDAHARVGNAYYVLFSRDPHLAAIGFVWNPLPSMTTMPLLLLSKLWPPLASYAFAGNVMSAVFMAWAVVVVRRIFDDLRVPRSSAVLLTILFAAHPMISYSGANGMTEGLFVFLLVLAARHLMQYLETAETAPLAKAGLALAFAYYARNEAVAAIAGAGLTAFAVQFARTRGGRRQRVHAALGDLVVVCLPGVFAFVTWAVASWIIVRHPFEQFTSQYGTASQLTAMTAVGFRLADRSLAARMVFLMAPLLAVVVVVTAAAVVRRRDLRPLGALAVLGPVLAFAVVAYLAGQTAGWFRYFIAAAPLSVLLAGWLIAPSTARLANSQGRTKQQRLMPAAIAAALVVPSLIGEGVAMADPRVGQEEYLHLAHIFHPGPRPIDDQAPTPRARSLRERELRRSSVRIARYLDGLDLPHGAIITDTFSPCVPFIILASRHPTRFVITNDRDFKRILDSPSTFGARYILAPADGTLAKLDAINRAYPGLATDGSGVVDARPAKVFNEIACPEFHLYSVVDQ